MRLVTRFECAAKSTEQLYGLHQEIYTELIKSHPNTLNRVNALASLQNIELEITSRVLRP